MAQKQPTFLHRLRSKGPKPRRRTDNFYHTTRWRKLRRYALSREPLCRDPFGEHAEWSEVVSATEVDHIVPRRVRAELELSIENLQALCKRCHSRKTKAETRGFAMGRGVVDVLDQGADPAEMLESTVAFREALVLSRMGHEI